MSLTFNESSPLGPEINDLARNLRYILAVLQGARSKATLKPVIAENHIVAMKESVQKIVQTEFVPAQEHTKVFEKYRFLINKEVL